MDRGGSTGTNAISIKGREFTIDNNIVTIVQDITIEAL